MTKENKNPETDVKEEISSIEPDTLEPTMTYEEKIKSILGKVGRGEDVFPKEEINMTRQSIKDHGVKGAILRVFNESIGDYTLNEEESAKTIGDEGSTYFVVEPPSNYPDADQYWNRILPNLRNIGDVTTLTKHSGEINVELGSSGNPKELLNIKLVRNEAQNEKPSIFLSWDDASEMEEDEAKAILEKVGLGVDSVTVVGNGVVAEASP